MVDILFFNAPWCTACHEMAPILEELKEEGLGIDVKNVNVDDEENSELIRKYLIRGLPTLILKKEDRESRISSKVSKEVLAEAIATL